MTGAWRSLSLIISLLPTCLAAPIGGNTPPPDVTTTQRQITTVSTKTDMKKLGTTIVIPSKTHLQKFGYLDVKSEKVFDISAENANSKLRDAIKNFQNMTAVPQTGLLDNTIKMMQLPRCGNINNYRHSNQIRPKRYLLHETSWDKTTLTYGVRRYSSKLDPGSVDKEVDRAFQAWRSKSNLNFVKAEKHKDPDIEIRFVSGEHNDSYPFDGPGNIMAHSFYPYFGGDLHIDDDEDWAAFIHTGSGPSLYNVVLHEIGHTLGLEHSTDPQAVMYQYYKSGTATLERDDIQGIQSIYGLPEYCSLTKVDAFTRYDDGRDYVFAGSYLYKLGERGVIQTIKLDDLHLPSNVDAALYLDPPVNSTTGDLYVFKGWYVWRIRNNRVSPPRLISKEFPGVPDNIDAAFVWGGNNRTYIFKGDEYFQLARGARAVDRGYPQRLSVWSLTGPVDAVTWASDWHHYFFKGQQYQCQDAFQNGEVHWMDIAERWFGCPAPVDRLNAT